MIPLAEQLYVHSTARLFQIWTIKKLKFKNKIFAGSGLASLDTNITTANLEGYVP